MKKILVVNGPSYGKAVIGLGELSGEIDRFMLAPKDFTMVMFTGGADVSPHLYGDTSPKNFCQTNPIRDTAEIRIFNRALENGILCTGICRGVQFINVMSGGRMIHHLEGHAGSLHSAITTTAGIIRVNSFHHQMILPPDSAIVTATSSSRMSHLYIGENDAEVEYKGPEVEAAVFPETKCFGVQWHPEMMQPNTDGFGYYYDMVSDALDMPWEDFVGHYRGTEVHEAAV